MSSRKRNGRATNGHSNGHGTTQRVDHDRMSMAQMELLRNALVEHGKRMAAIESMINRAMDDLLVMKKSVVDTQVTVNKIVDKLNIDLDE